MPSVSSSTEILNPPSPPNAFLSPVVTPFLFPILAMPSDPRRTRLNSTSQRCVTSTSRCCTPPPTPPDADVVASFLAAAEHADIQAMTRPVRSGAIRDITQARDPGNNQTALHKVAIAGRSDAVLALFELARGVGGAEPHYSHYSAAAAALIAAVDERQRTALHVAANDDVAERLIALGASTFVTDSDGYTPAQVARIDGRRDVEHCIRMRETALGA